MKNESLLQPHLLEKFNQLPVPANAAAGWNNMEKTLQIAMPVGLLGLALYLKVWLSKKLVLLGVATLSVGTGVTALVVYQSRQASLATATNQPNKPNTQTVPVVADTTHRVSKTRKIARVAKRDTVHRLTKTRTAVARDTVSRVVLRKTARPTGDTINLKQRWLRGDTSIHFTRKSKTVPGRLDTLRPVRKAKTTGLTRLTNIAPARKTKISALRADSGLRPGIGLKQRWLRGDTSIRIPRKNKMAPLRVDAASRPARKIAPTPKDTSANPVQRYRTPRAGSN